MEFVSCINDDDLTAFLDGELPKSEMGRVHEHVSDCSDCRQLVHAIEALGDGSDAASISKGIAPGMRVGRYLLDRELGTGATGVVYLAHDPDLDRRVALKILHQKAEGSTPAQRAVREAQAMAKLNHANVRAVYDVGVIDNCFYLALEYVDGVTLRDWVAGNHSLQEIVDVFVQAGRGLAAAHEAGLIHRDFKPDNVLVNREGVVKVTDLGLAMFLANDEPPALPATSSAELFFDDKLTKTGTVVGTPAYMSPEQFRGIVDEKSDQFSFCVALFEALAGRRPFAGENVLEILKNARAHAMVETLRPRWLGRIVERGLQPDPGLRHSSMQALVNALLGRRKRIRTLAIVLVVGAMFGGVAYAWPKPATGMSDECAAAGNEIRVLWSDSERTEISDAFASSGAAYKRDSGVIVTEALDNYARQYVLAKQSSCQNEGLIGATETWPQIAEQCLDERLTAFRTTLKILREGDAKSLSRFVDILATLPRVEDCTSASHLMSYSFYAEPETNRAWKEGREWLIEAKTLAAAGNNAAALEKLQATLVNAEAFKIPELQARALVRQCSIEAGAGRLVEAEQTCQAAATAAVAAGKLKFAVLSWGVLTGLLAQDATRLHDAHQWASYAAAALAESTQLDPDIEMTVATALGLLARSEARYQDADGYYRRALQTSRDMYGNDDYRTVSALNNLAVLEADIGKLADSAQHHEQSLQLRKRYFGPRHPKVAVALVNAAIPLRKHPDTRDRAKTYLIEALEIANESAPDNKILHHAIHNGLGHQYLGNDTTKAILHFENAIRLATEQFGPEHALAATSMEGLALCLTSDADQARALEIQTEVLRIRTKYYGETSEPTARSLYNVALVLLRLDRLPEAMAHAQSYRDVAEQLPGNDPSDFVTALGLVGRIHNMEGQWRLAQVPLRRAADILAEGNTTLSAIDRGNIYWDLCSALWQGKASLQEAEKAARASLSAFEESGSEAHIQFPKNWLAERNFERDENKTKKNRN